MFCCAAPADAVPSELVENQAHGAEDTKVKERVFVASFKKDDAEAGIGAVLEEVFEGSTLRVAKVVEDGPVSHYNKDAPDDEQIAEGDYVMAINQVQGNGETLIQELHSNRDVHLRISKPHIWEVTLEKKDGESYGMGLKCPPNCVALGVSGVQEGAAADWNDKHSDAAIKTGDRIIAINDVNGPLGTDMIDVLKSHNSVKCTMSRAAHA